MDDELITLWRYRDLPEALIAQSKLVDGGVPSLLRDENIVRMIWYLSNTVGGMRLEVAAKDAEAAMALLAEEIPASFTAEEVGEEYQQPACPKCGSLDVDFEPWYRGLALVVLHFFSLPLLIPKKSWKCEDCGQNWQAPWV